MAVFSNIFPNKAQREQTRLPLDGDDQMQRSSCQGDQSRDISHFDFRHSTDKQLPPKEMK